MDKYLEIIKNILLCIATYLLIKYLIVFDLNGGLFIIYISLYILFVATHIRDYYKKDKIVHDMRYNVLSIISLFIISFIFFRCLYSKSFFYNIDNNLYNNTIILNIDYLNQNMIYFITILLLLLFYHKNNIDLRNNQYNMISIFCMMISITQIFIFSDIINNNWYYILLNFILIGIEVFLLIHDNHKKHEWPIYVSWFFNLIVIVSSIIGF